MYTPVCEMPLPDVLKNTRSPVRKFALDTGVPALACSCDVRGKLMLYLLKIYLINPEQSKPASVVPPHLYGMPVILLTTVLIVLASVLVAPDVNSTAAPKMEIISFFKISVLPSMPTELAKGSVEGSLYFLCIRIIHPKWFPRFQT